MLSKLTAAAVLALLIVSPVHATTYELRDLGTLPGCTEYYPTSVNSHGQVVGRAIAGSNWQAFYYDSSHGIMAIPGAGIAYAINEDGVVLVDGDKLWDLAGGLRSPGIVINGGLCMNDAGVIGGQYASQAATWDAINGTKTYGTLTGDTSAWTRAINNNGQFAGTSDGAWPLVHGFFYDPIRGMQDVGCLAGYYSSGAWGINDSGVVVGSCRSYDQKVRRPFIWDSVNGLRDLGFSGEAADINNAGLIAASRSKSVGSSVVLIDPVTGLQELPSSYSAFPECISENGLVTGSYMPASTSSWRAAMWVPVPEPSSVAALLAGIGGMMLVAFRRPGSRC